jgi:hypothetical protein
LVSTNGPSVTSDPPRTLVAVPVGCSALPPSSLTPRCSTEAAKSLCACMTSFMTSGVAVAYRASSS